MSRDYEGVRLREAIAEKGLVGGLANWWEWKGYFAHCLSLDHGLQRLADSGHGPGTPEFDSANAERNAFTRLGAPAWPEPPEASGELEAGG